MANVPLITPQIRSSGGILNTWVFNTASDVTCSGTSVTLISTTINLAGNSKLLFWYTEPNLTKTDAGTNPDYVITIPGVTIPLDTNHIFHGDNGFRNGISWLTYSNSIGTGGTKTLTLSANRYNTGSITFGFQGRVGKLIVMEIAE